MSNLSGGVGSVPYQRELSQLGLTAGASGTVNALRLQEQLTLGGFLSLTLPGTYRLTTACIMASDTTLELGPGVILDASSMSVPCITATSKSYVRLCGDGVIRCSAASVPSFTNCTSSSISVEIVGLISGDDTVGLTAQFLSAGDNGTICLDPGRTYNVWGGIRCLSGQKVIGNGATIKRKAQVSSAYVSSSANNVSFVTTFVSASHKYIRVSNAALFSVGAIVCLTNNDGAGDGYSTGYYATPPTVNYTDSARIIEVNTSTNTITLERALTTKYTAGGGTPALNDTGATYLATSCALFYVGNFDSTLTKGAWASRGSDIYIDDVIFDGNRANQSKAMWWDIANDIWACCDNLRVRGCKFINSMGDSIVFSGYGAKINDNYFSTLSGNATHPSDWDGSNGCVDAVISRNYAKTTNIDLTIGHATGCYTFSNNCLGIVYSDNNIDGSGSWGVGGGFNSTDAEASAVGNIIRNCTRGAFQVSGGAKFTFSANVVTNCGEDTPSGQISVSCIESTSEQVSISGNAFRNSPLIIRGSCKNVAVSGNAFKETAAQGSNWKIASLYCVSRGEAAITGNVFEYDAAASTNMDAIYLNGATNVVVGANRIARYSRGIRMNGNVVNSLISGNHITDCYNENIQFNAGSSQDNIAIRGNHCTHNAGATVASGCSCIRVNPAGTNYVTIESNTVRSFLASGTCYGIAYTGNSYANIVNNDVRKVSAGGVSIYTSGTTDATMRLLGNRISHAITVAGSPTLVWNGTGDTNLVA